MMNESLILYVIAAILILSTKFPFNKTLALIVFFVYLLNALPTGADYAYYKAGFENVELINSPPYISTDYLDSEPLYLLHMYLLKKVVWNFNLYLAVSFILWAFLSKMALTKLNVPKKDFRFIFICALPVVIPVICYWSPRSAISLPLLLLSYNYFEKKNFLLGFILSILAGSFHSQYIPFSIVLILMYSISNYLFVSILKNAVFVSLIILGMLRFGADSLSFIFTSESISIFSLAISKLHYFSDPAETGSIRLSGLLIISIDFLYLIYFRKRVIRVENYGLNRNSQSRIWPLVDISCIFSIITNILFINEAHVAGRVSRFPDYFVMCIAFPLVIRIVSGKNLSNLIIVLYSFVSMLAFGNIYIYSS